MLGMLAYWPVANISGLLRISFGLLREKSWLVVSFGQKIGEDQKKVTKFSWRKFDLAGGKIAGNMARWGKK